MRKKLVLAGMLSAMASYSITDSALAAGAGINTVPNLDQGLSATDLDRFYNMTQGSRLLPVSWIYALEEKGSEREFLTKDKIEKYRLIASDPAGNPLPNRLPLGFAIDESSDSNLTRTKLRWLPNQSTKEPWMGLTCGACHTSEVAYNGQSFVVPGGQSMMDLTSFLKDLVDAAGETLSDNYKFDRFAQKVLAPNAANDSNKQALRTAFEKWYAWTSFFNGLFPHGENEYGPSRIDAIGLIFGETAVNVGAANVSPLPTNAPVNPPMLWNVPQHDKVQWDGLIPNDIKIGKLNISALGRNIGEATGVFADVKITALAGVDVLGPLSPGYESSINVLNMVDLENVLYKMRPPRWPTEIFGQINQAAVLEGEKLFRDKGCASCHAVLKRTDLSTPIKANMARIWSKDPAVESLATDPLMACNAAQAAGYTGVMKGMKVQPITSYSVTDAGTTLGERALMADIGTVSYIQIILNQKFELAARILFEDPLAAFGALIDAMARSFTGFLINKPNEPFVEFSGDPSERLEQCKAMDSDLIAYKARPLNGIWASAPYLHNGSIPTLYDILLPPNERPKKFYAGTTEFDPILVGYRTDSSSAYNTFLFDAEKTGNSNLGHDYNVGTLTDTQRMQMVEYMKTL